MLKTAVYRFLYFDRATQVLTMAPDFATRRAIAAMGATIIEDTGVMIDSRIIGSAGLLLASQMPEGEPVCAEEEPRARRQARRRESTP